MVVKSEQLPCLSRGKGGTYTGTGWACPELALEIQTLDLRREPEPMAITSLASVLAEHLTRAVYTRVRELADGANLCFQKEGITYVDGLSQSLRTWQTYSI